MATYTTIANSAVDPNAPVTSELMTALRDNPLAITEGSSGAPKVQPEALELVYGSGSASGLATLISVYDLDNVNYIVAQGEGTVTSTPSASRDTNIEYRLSTDNGSTWGSYVRFQTITAGAGSITVTEYKFSIIDISSANAIQFAQNDSDGSTSIIVAGFGV